MAAWPTNHRCTRAAVPRPGAGPGVVRHCGAMEQPSVEQSPAPIAAETAGGAAAPRGRSGPQSRFAGPRWTPWTGVRPRSPRAWPSSTGCSRAGWSRVGHPGLRRAGRREVDAAPPGPGLGGRHRGPVLWSRPRNRRPGPRPGRTARAAPPRACWCWPGRPRRRREAIVARLGPELVVVDSIQTVADPRWPGAAGS